jgi:hypothetical protein
MQVVFMTPSVIQMDMQLKVLTYSMHAGLIPVGTLGRDRPKGFCKGNRTIAGSMIVTLSMRDPFMELQPIMFGSNNNYAKSTSDVWRTYLLPDQMPPFDILCMFTNEYGFTATMPIFGVKITDVGSVFAMSDSEIEVTYTYQALDIDIIRQIEQNEDGTTTIDVTTNNEYLAKRAKAYNGESEHRSTFEVPTLYGALDRRAQEISYQQFMIDRSIKNKYSGATVNGVVVDPIEQAVQSILQSKKSKKNG